MLYLQSRTEEAVTLVRCADMSCEGLREVKILGKQNLGKEWIPEHELFTFLSQFNALTQKSSASLVDSSCFGHLWSLVSCINRRFFGVGRTYPPNKPSKHLPGSQRVN